eukprot:1553945-Prorocentrum_lima.AAC.1
MTSSLVGSEMCIRDRASATRTAAAAAGCRAASSFPAPAWSGVLCGWVWVCLLYTSDAADDM